jgi:rod shape-determining protein MreD
MDLAPLPDASPSTVAPDFVLAVLFFWSLHRAELVPPLGLFLLGLGSDLVGGSFTGLTPLSLLLVREIVVRRRRMLLGAGPLLRWVSFAGLMCVLGVARLGLVSMLDRHWHDPVTVMAATMLTVMAWPIVTILLVPLQAMLPKVRHAAGS